MIISLEKSHTLIRFDKTTHEMKDLGYQLWKCCSWSFELYLKKLSSSWHRLAALCYQWSFSMKYNNILLYTIIIYLQLINISHFIESLYAHFLHIATECRSHKFYRVYLICLLPTWVAKGLILGCLIYQSLFSWIQCWRVAYICSKLLNHHGSFKSRIAITKLNFLVKSIMISTVCNSTFNCVYSIR